METETQEDFVVKVCPVWFLTKRRWAAVAFSFHLFTTREKNFHFCAQFISCSVFTNVHPGERQMEKKPGKQAEEMK